MAIDEENTVPAPSPAGLLKIERLKVQVVKLRLGGFHQATIADQLGVSRAFVSAALEEARQTGVQFPRSRPKDPNEAHWGKLR